MNDPMIRYKYLLPVLFLLFSMRIEAQGLKFNGNEKLIDDRTSYNVFTTTPVFKNMLDLSFDLLIAGPSDIGYILRLKDIKATNTYNLFLNSLKDSIQFKFNIEGKQSLITANLPRKEAMNNLLHIGLRFNLNDSKLEMKINQSVYRAEGILLPAKIQPSILFGRSDYFIDVPSIIIKNLVIKDHKTSYTFRFDENQGSEVHDINGRVIGEVQNPFWLIDDSYYWRLKKVFFSKTVAGINYNEEKQSIYYFNKDSIFMYHIGNKEEERKKYPVPCPLDLNLATNFIYAKENLLYVYEAMPNDPKGDNLSRLNLEDLTWQPATYEPFKMQLHHHSTAIDTANRKYYIFGGFGNQHYSNKLYVFDLNTNKWKELVLSGDLITPRYFSSMVYSPRNHSLYLFGGMGNESGEQIVGRRYYYDFYQIDLKTLKVTKKWDLHWKSENIVPTRNLILTDDSNFYTLCYPEHYSDSYLQLYQFSIQDGSFQIKGDSIPIHSEKIKTNACLYFNPKLSEFYAIVQEFANDDIASDVKIYSLNYSPVTLSELSRYHNPGNIDWLFSKRIRVIGGITLGIILCLLFLVLYYTRHKIPQYYHKKSSLREKESGYLATEAKVNAIFLFGTFTVKNREGKNITYLFSPKIKQIFLILLQYSVEEGITSQELSQLLWPNKAESKVKNSRGVTISNLRKVLEELDGIRLIYEKGIFKIITTEDCYCDYCYFKEIKASDHSKDNFRKELLKIISRGKFLKDSNFPEVDKFKEIVEQELIPFLLIEMEESYREEDYPNTIAFADAMLNIDPVNETAFDYLIHSLQKTNAHSEAKRRSIQFISDYKQIMGEDYQSHP